MEMSIRFPGLNLVLSYVPRSFQIFGMEFTIYGVLIAIGALLGIGLVTLEAKRNGEDQNKYLDNTDRSKTLGKLPTPDRAWKSNDLCQKKCQDHLGRVNAYLAAVAGCHGDDRVDTVNIKEVA